MNNKVLTIKIITSIITLVTSFIVFIISCCGAADANNNEIYFNAGNKWVYYFDSNNLLFGIVIFLCLVTIVITALKLISYFIMKKEIKASAAAVEAPAVEEAVEAPAVEEVDELTALKEKLASLKAMKEDGLISDEEYAEMRKEALAK